MRKDEMEEIVRSIDFALMRLEDALDAHYSTRTDRTALREAKQALDLLDPEKKWREE